jgi:glutathione S-transferase
VIALYHGGPSGHSASVLIALAEKDIAFASRPVDLDSFAQHRAEYLALNPAGQVPVLVEGDRTLTESFFILLYLDEQYPRPALGGSDARARYAVQKWGKYVETHIAPKLAIVRWAASGAAADAECVAGFGRLPPERRALWERAAAGFGSEEADAARTAIAKAAQRIDEALAEGPWLAGAAYSLADIVVFPHVALFEEAGVSPSPALRDWMDRIRARPQVRQALGEPADHRAPVTMGPEFGRWG